MQCGQQLLEQRNQGIITVVGFNSGWVGCRISGNSRVYCGRFSSRINCRVGSYSWVSSGWILVRRFRSFLGEELLKSWQQQFAQFVDSGAVERTNLCWALVGIFRHVFILG
ncbi:hypothetical protein D3C80_1641270 [compost metagenome]